MPEQWTCVSADASTTNCTVTASSTPPVTGSGYNGPNFQEWLFTGGVLIFFVSFMAWGRIFRPVKRTFYDN